MNPHRRKDDEHLRANLPASSDEDESKGYQSCSDSRYFQTRHSSSINQRQFRDGREEQTDCEQYRSLNDQRNYSNAKRKNKNYNRGRPWGRRGRGNNWRGRGNFSRGYSNNSNGQQNNPSFANNDHPDIESTSSVSMSLNEFGNEAAEVSLTHRQIETDSNVNSSSNVNDAEKSFKKPVKDNLRKFKEYQKMLQEMDPTEVIMECRQDIEEMTKQCINSSLKRQREINSKIASQKDCLVLKTHLNNFRQQQVEFETYIAKIKTELSYVLTSNIAPDMSELLSHIQKMKDSVQFESKIFQRALPLYAYKNQILEKLVDNDVLIISGDPAYFSNVLVPIFVKNQYPKHKLLLCESNKFLLSNLSENILYLVTKSIGIQEMNEKQFYREFTFTTEECMKETLSMDYTHDEKETITIMNLPLQRSLTLDIILADIQESLKNESNSKLILIVSSYDNVSKYHDFFSEYCNADKIELPSLILPVKTHWKGVPLSSFASFTTDSVTTIISILHLTEEGDIMMFVPILSDAKAIAGKLNQKLCELQYRDAECVIVSENSEKKAGMGIFFSKQSLKRQILIGTECMEKLTVPSVSHVIDCGLKKGNVFDSQKKLDVLATTFVSQSKAKLRKSLAGAFSGGFCYRLYSREEYKDMPQNELPELLTVNPFNSMIKIFQHRPNAAADIDFVQNLSNASKEKALNMLKKYSAVKNNELTRLGKMIVKLPYPVRYSKLILLGSSRKMLYETIVLVAFFSIKGRVFQFHKDPELQRRTDAIKMRFLIGDSDSLSYLNVYKLWQESGMSEEWCVEHSINSSTLKNVDAKVKDIIKTVEESLQESVFPEFTDDASGLVEILFECFQDNLCVFTGHTKSGYRMLDSHCIAFVHPSSLVSQVQHLPQFIIFDHFTLSTRDFLECITTVPSELVMDALTNGMEFDYSDMFEKSLVQRSVEPYGELLIKRVLLAKDGKVLRYIENEIKKAIKTDSLVIEPIPENGKVNVYALKNYIEPAAKCVRQILDRHFEDVINAEETNILELRRGENVVPVEVNWLKGARVTSVKAGVEDVTSRIKNNLSISGANDQSGNTVQKSINLVWIRRPCNGQALITFQPREFVQARKHAMRYIEFLGTEIFVQISRNESNQLLITELPVGTRAEDLKHKLATLLKISDSGSPKVELKYLPPFETSENVLREIKSEIEEKVQQITTLTNFNVIVPSVKPSATMMKAFVNVMNEDDDIDLASKSMENIVLGRHTVICKPVYRSVIRCSTAVCENLQTRFQDELTKLQSGLQKKLNVDDVFEFEINKVNDDVAAIKMLSNYQEVLSVLQASINNLLRGVILQQEFNSKLNKIFCHGGHIWLKAFEKVAKIHVIEDSFNKTLRLYGSVEDVESAKRRIKRFLEDTDNEAVKNVSLSNFGNPRKLLKEVICRYGGNLEKLTEACSLQSAVLDIKKCVIALHGSRQGIDEGEELLRTLAAGLGSHETEVLSNEELCPVCACPAFNLTVRLQLCGHLYCSECIQGLVEQAQLPIICCQEDCSKDIVLDDISKALGEDPEKIKALVQKSMKNFIEDHRQEIFSCPAPDCAMFFYKDDIKENKINCSLCQNDICVRCNVVFHHGFTCDMYQGSKNDSDFSFKIWQKDVKDCKRCPRCKTAIEKSGGCDHMTCNSCKAHFCWQCLGEFSKETIYEHLPFCRAYN